MTLVGEFQVNPSLQKLEGEVRMVVEPQNVTGPDTNSVVNPMDNKQRRRIFEGIPKFLKTGESVTLCNAFQGKATWEDVTEAWLSGLSRLLSQAVITAGVPDVDVPDEEFDNVGLATVFTRGCVR